MATTNPPTTAKPVPGRAAFPYLILLLAAVAAVLAALELSVRIALPRLSRIEGRIEAEYRAARLLRAGHDPSTLFFAGNSLLLTDVDIPKLQAGLAPHYTTSRWAIEQTTYLDWFYALRLWYSSGASADVVVLCLNTRQIDSLATRGDYFGYRMMRTADFLRAAQDARLPPTATFSLLLASGSAFYGTRSETRKVLLGRLVPGVSEVARMAAPLPDRSQLDPAAAIPETTARLERMASLVARHRGQLLLLVPATTDAQDVAILTAAGSRSRVPVLVPLDAAEVSPADFEDSFHLNGSGRVRYTGRLIPALRRTLGARTEGPR